MVVYLFSGVVFVEVCSPVYALVRGRAMPAGAGADLSRDVAVQRADDTVALGCDGAVVGSVGKLTLVCLMVDPSSWLQERDEGVGEGSKGGKKFTHRRLRIRRFFRRFERELASIPHLAGYSLSSSMPMMSPPLAGVRPNSQRTEGQSWLAL